MLLLVLFPILYYYATPLSYSWGEVLLILYVIYQLFTRGKFAFKFPKYFIAYWSYCAVALVVLSNTFKITYLIPGGISAFIWCFMLGVLLSQGDNSALLKYFRLIFVPVAILFVIQEISFKVTGSRFCFYLPISSDTANYGDLTFKQLEALYRFYDRSASVFMEPAYFAEFLLVHLVLELFGGDHVDKLYTPWAIFICLILLILRSGTGLMGLALLVTIKLVSFYKRKRSNYLIALILIVLPLIYFGSVYYLSTEVGESMMKRSSELTEQSGSSYDRIFRGLELFNAMPLLNQYIGIDPSIFRASNMYNGVETLKEGMLYNGFQTVLISYGFIGTFLILLVYISIYRKSSILTKSALLLLLLLSWIESLYLTPLMLILTVIAYTSKRQYRNKNLLIEIKNENSNYHNWS